MGHSFPLFLEGAVFVWGGFSFLKIIVNDIWIGPHLSRHTWVIKIMKKLFPIVPHKQVSSNNYRVWASYVYFICGAETTLGTEITRSFFKAHQVALHHLSPALVNQGGSRLLEAGQCVHPQEGLEGGFRKLQACHPDLDAWRDIK